MCRDMGIHFDRVRHLALHSVKDLKIVNDHHAIYDAIRSGNALQGEKIMENHLSRFKIDEEFIRKDFPNYFVS